MKVRLKRPTTRNKQTGLYNIKVYKLIGANVARKLAHSEALEHHTNVYAHNSNTGKMLYLYTDRGELQDFTKERHTT